MKISESKVFSVSSLSNQSRANTSFFQREGQNNFASESKDQAPPFFQPKLTIGQANDKYEKEADAVADAVVNQTTGQSALQAKNISTIQRYMTNAEFDERGTNTERIEEDKRIQEKPEVQRKPIEIIQNKEGDEEKKTWTRKLKTPPQLLNYVPFYEVHFDHEIPHSDTNAKQVWQVVEVDLIKITEDCKQEQEKKYVVDIVNIGDRKKIKDKWRYRERKKYCFVREITSATIGFDDGKGLYAQQTGIFEESEANKILQNMTGPIGTYSGEYSFVKSENCPDCEKLKEFESACCSTPEYLHIEGVGEW